MLSIEPTLLPSLIIDPFGVPLYNSPKLKGNEKLSSFQVSFPLGFPFQIKQEVNGLLEVETIWARSVPLNAKGA